MAGGVFWPSPIQVGDQHLARLFLEAGWQVGFLSIPISPFHLFAQKSPELRARYETWRKGGIWQGRLWYYVPGSLLVPNRLPLLNSVALYRKWHWFTVPKIRSVLNRAGFSQAEVIYFRDPRYGFLLDMVQHSKSVFRLADNDSAFEHQIRHAHRIVQRDVLSAVSHVCYTAKTLEADVARSGARNAMFLENGVWLDHFSGPRQALPADLAEIPKPIAIYVGSIHEWFDFDLVRYAASKLAHVSFVLIGHPESARSKLSDLSNVRILGMKPFAQIPGYLQHADVGIIPFDVERHRDLVNAINPLKLYEYLAAGLPTVTVAWEELRRIRPPAALCNSRDEFVTAIADFLKNPPAKEPLLDFASERDWRRVFRDLTDFLDV